MKQLVPDCDQRHAYELTALAQEVAVADTVSNMRRLCHSCSAGLQLEWLFTDMKPLKKEQLMLLLNKCWQYVGIIRP